MLMAKTRVTKKPAKGTRTSTTPSSTTGTKETFGEPPRPPQGEGKIEDGPAATVAVG
jgi:hypothetical protein